MKFTLPTTILLSLGIVSLPNVLRAEAVQPSLVPSDIEWFVHVDVDHLRETRSGSILMNKLMEIEFEGGESELPIEPALILNGLKGITAFGTMPDIGTESVETVDAAVTIHGTPELMQVFRGMVSGFQLENPEALVEVESGDQIILKMNGEDICGSFLEGDRIVLGKSLDSLVDFLEVYRGDAASLSLDTRFPTYRLGPETGIFLGAFVEDISGLKNLPAQARILQLTQSVSLQLGESGDFLKLLASLKTDGTKTATQVQEVLQGILALMTITQNGNPDITALLQNSRVGREDTIVTLNLAYPVDSAEVWLQVLSDMIEENMQSEAGEPAPADTGAGASNDAANSGQ